MFAICCLPRLVVPILCSMCALHFKLLQLDFIALFITWFYRDFVIKFCNNSQKIACKCVFALSLISFWIETVLPKLVLFFWVSVNFVYWSFVAPVQNEFSVMLLLLSFTINMYGSAYLTLNTEYIQGSRRSDFWALQFLAKTSQKSCSLKIILAKKLILPRKLLTLKPKLALMDTV